MNQTTDSATFQSQMKMMTGPNQAHENALTPDVMKKIQSDYYALYFSLAFANWMQGNTLGGAWYTGLEQIKQKVNAADANSSAGKYLRTLHAAHTKKWSQVIMTSPHRDAKITCPPQQRAEWMQKNADMMTNALRGLNATIAAHHVAPRQSDKSAAYEKAISVMMLKQMQMQKQYA